MTKSERIESKEIWAEQALSELQELKNSIRKLPKETALKVLQDLQNAEIKITACMLGDS